MFARSAYARVYPKLSHKSIASNPDPLDLTLLTSHTNWAYNALTNTFKKGEKRQCVAPSNTEHLQL